MKSILLVKKLLGLAEMTFGLVTASFSLPFGQAVKMIFFARCSPPVVFLYSYVNFHKCVSIVLALAVLSCNLMGKSSLNYV